ncbi:MAG: TlpA family protein disulfide reductase [Actinomycetota bacterium]
MAAVLALVVAACGGAGGDEVSSLPDLPDTNAAEFTAHMADLDRPAVVNVWASWCLPCRSEAPLLDQAHKNFGDQIEFIGVDVQDSQPDAKKFLEEYGLEFDHFFDANRAIPSHYGGLGTPITMFFAPHGELLTIHNGVIDEQTLAVNIDELTRLEG